MAKQADLFLPVLSSARALAAPLRTDASSAGEAETLAVLLPEVERFCKERIDPVAVDERQAIGESLLRELADQGFFGLTVPAAHGGVGLSLKAASRVVTELAGRSGSVGTCVGLHSGLALHALLHLADPGLQARYLPDVAAGRRIASFAATEPCAGSDLAALRSKLTEQDGRLVLSGSKCYVTNGGLAGLLTTVASSPGLGGARAGHTMVLLDPSWPGVTRQREEKKMGLKASSTISIDYDGVVIPRDHLLGTPGLGLEHAHRALTWGRTFMAAGCVGPARAAVAAAEEHTRNRVQFGRPLARFPLVRHALAAGRADVYAMQSLLRLVGACHDQGIADIALPSTALKIFVSEAAFATVDRCLQLLGGFGFMQESEMGRRLCDLRVTRIFEGANDVLRLSLASATLGWRAAPLEPVDRLASFAPPALADAAAAVDAVLAQSFDRVGAVRKELGFRLFDRQLLQSHLADALVAAYAALACVLRAAGADPAEPTYAQELATARLAVSRLTGQATAALARAFGSRDDEELGRDDAVLG